MGQGVAIIPQIQQQEGIVSGTVGRVCGLSLAGFLCSALILAAAQTSQTPAAKGSTAAPAAQKSAPPPVPHYFHSLAAAKPFPKLIPASDFADKPVVARSYEIAHKIPGVLAQQPCYCHCDEHFNHRSLLDCHASTHTAGCAICVKETYLVWQLYKQGKTAKQIRAAIMRGDWEKIDINQPPL